MTRCAEIRYFVLMDIYILWNGFVTGSEDGIITTVLFMSTPYDPSK